MVNIFKSTPTDVKGIRNALLQFIKEQLQKVEGSEGGNIKGIYLYIRCKEGDRFLYESAVYADQPNRFKDEEIQRLADDYMISLPALWTFDISFTDTPPVEAVTADDIDAAIFLSTKGKPVAQAEKHAYLKVLGGEAEKDVYIITSASGVINIGRESRVQTADGFYRLNTIAFPENSKSTANRSVSRQHAHIEWNNENAAFYIYADEGGIPPMNKVKVRNTNGEIEKIQTTEIGFRLYDGCQIMIGESALLEFTGNAPEKH